MKVITRTATYQRFDDWTAVGYADGSRECIGDDGWREFSNKAGWITIDRRERFSNYWALKLNGFTSQVGWLYDTAIDYYQDAVDRLRQKAAR
jgi:hypothetical protein